MHPKRHDRRLDALRTELDARGIGAALISRAEYLFYFTGYLYSSSPAFLIVLPQALVAVAPEPLPKCETFTYTNYDIHQGWNTAEGAAQALERAFDHIVPRNSVVGLEAAHLPAVFLEVVGRQTNMQLDVANQLASLVRIKDANEINQIETSIAANDMVFQAVQKSVRSGITEIELWAVIYRKLCEASGGPIHRLEGNLGVGLRGVNNDAQPGPSRLAQGDSMFVDIYTRIGGYYADTTRVFTLGNPTGTQQKIHNILVDALRAGEDMLRPGVPAYQVDAAVRGVIERAGYGNCFPHHSGHSFGLFAQERPFLIPAEKTVLEEGMVIAVEPGIYVPNWGGMRLERNFLVESGGARRLDQFPIDIVVC